MNAKEKQAFRQGLAVHLPTPEATTKDGDDVWLQRLHSSYVDRYLADNDRTWSTAVWLITISWSLFPAAVALGDELRLSVIVVFGGASTALVWLWFVIATWHRVWASRSYDIVRVIEGAVLGAKPDADLHDALRVAHSSPWGAVGAPMTAVRAVIAGGTTVAWILMGISLQVGWLDIPVTP